MFAVACPGRAVEFPAMTQNLTVSSASTWSDALDRAGIDAVVRGLRRVSGSLPFVGRAVTVREETAPLGTYAGEAFPFGKRLSRTVQLAKIGTGGKALFASAEDDAGSGF